MNWYELYEIVLIPPFLVVILFKILAIIISGWVSSSIQ